MAPAINTGHLRSVALSVAEVKTITLLTKNAGEVEWHGENASPAARAVIERMVQKRLIEHVNRGTALSPVPKIRLTDEGRAVAGQLEAMAVKPKIEVTSA